MMVTLCLDSDCRLAPRRLLAAAWAAVTLIAGPGAAAAEVQSTCGGEAHLPETSRETRAYKLATTDFTNRVQWGGWCVLSDGSGLRFGGADQGADDGNPHTQVKRQGAWVAIHEELRAANPLQTLHDRAWALRNLHKNATAKAGRIYFSGLPAADETGKIRDELLPALTGVGKDLDKLVADIKSQTKKLKEYEAGQAGFALTYAGDASARLRRVMQAAAAALSAETIKELAAVRIALEKVAEALDAEPPPRALSPVVYDAKSGLYVVFGGDHLDYLTCDTWVFDPTRGKWMQRHPKSAPAPRANHLLSAAGDGKIALTNGYTYADQPWYQAAQYRDVGDGTWTYDVAADVWTGGEGVAADTRTYRSGPFAQEFFLQGAKPSATENEARLKALPVNTWVDMKPPQTLMLDRDWGTAVLDTDRDMILYWSGGHCAHGGTDVPHYHLSCNRWEMPNPIEYPLGSLQANTLYPVGRNFNLRPWMVGHTYRSYGYDPVLKKMVFTGRPSIYGKGVEHQDHNFYIYDPDVADWTTRALKPKEMSYTDSFFTLTHCATPQGSFVWTKDGKLFRLDAAGTAFAEVKLSGDALPGASCDGACLVLDAKRNRLLGIRTTPGKDGYKFDGEVYAVDLKSFEVKALNPAGKAGVAGMGFTREADYDVANDLMLVATPLPGNKDHLAVYDCASNRWSSAAFGGPNPAAGGYGYNVNLGLSYDARRGLHWAVGQYGEIRVLRIDVPSARIAPL
jgi:hypothetical protein